ncbi:hypothetical protein [Oceanirhabdus seepicola]|uniref:Uncharacterized protein n=1 Tax=Oceanirhabdus seepicola TaxID=2828781 RepID=A0A9J6NYG9_9CLOT|nr:hypothetical protein [Oceanirhabdus seepicola]MCM1988945.1 hypothetical protein [Oceanirhabdus seepicola]
MYCPKCERQYTDGSLRCKECNQKLIVKLPMKKVKKNKLRVDNHPVRGEKKKRDAIEEMLFKIIFLNKHSNIYFFGFLISLFLIYFTVMVVAYENMDLKDALLVIDICKKVICILVLTLVLIVFGYGLEDWKYYKKLRMKNKICADIIKGILILCIVTAEINILSKPVLDFIYKDNYISQGTVTGISEGWRGHITIFVDHEGYSYIKRLKSVEIGDTYTFTYSKRSHLILGIK